MKILYEKLIKLDIDHSCLGLMIRESESEYFCTPKGSKVIGWSGVDGVHYSFVRGFGEMVFVISPMNTPGEYVHPVARDFISFLRLLLACGDASALDDIYWEDQEHFDSFLQNNPPTPEQQAALDTIREAFQITPMERPFSYVKAIQAEFDYSRVKYPKEYDETISDEPKIPEWMVCFEGSFWGRHERERSGEEISINKQFLWDGEVWIIPSIYICSKGLVVDFCVQVPVERIRSFMEKWDLSYEKEEPILTEDQRMEIEADHPLVTNINPQIVMNRNVLSWTHGSGITWNPCVPEAHGIEIDSVLHHYCLDPAHGWAIWRAAFPWNKKRKPQIETLAATLRKEPVAMAGKHFRVSEAGEHIEFIHPSSGVKHTLIIEGFERQEMSHDHFPFQNKDYPAHAIIMSYKLVPELPDAAFTVMDCANSDQFRPKPTTANDSWPSDGEGIIGEASSIGVICTAQDGLHAVCSSLHFEPTDSVEWRMVFHEKKCADVTVDLLA